MTDGPSVVMTKLIKLFDHVKWKTIWIFECSLL